MTALLLDHDEDGDGCTDWYELGENEALGGGRDPFNPNDCSVVLDASGTYDISHELLSGYRRCKADVQEVSKNVTARVYCYTDIPDIPVNPEVSDDCELDPAACGDGKPGAPPPEPYGDMDDTHAELTGTLDNATGMVSVSGCFEDRDGQDPLGHIYVVWAWNVQTGAGTSDTWLWQDQSECVNDDPQGTAETRPIQALKLGTADEEYDSDGDGCPDKDELQDYDPVLEPVPGKRGELRDPYNRWDYYDAGGPGNGPPDGVIDMANDIIGVIQRYSANPTLPYDENYDRPAVTAGSTNHWNRGAPDGTIDMPNDILGVIQQYQHCPP